MYFYLILLGIILLLIVSIYYFYQQSYSYSQESYENENSKISTEPDLNALKQYCEATNRNFEEYKKSIITEQHPKEVTKLAALFNKYKEVSWVYEVPKWSLVITDGTVEYGYAFTMGTTMYLPISYLQSLSEDNQADLLFHELRHIWQRQSYPLFIKSLDPEVWKEWRFQIVPNMFEAVSIMKSKGSEKVVINPDTFQIMAYYDESEHPVYPLMENDKLKYVVKNHSEETGWDDPHPCEWDAREAAQSVIDKEKVVKEKQL